jgi:4-hydroxy-tetrahydrodipicolinate reductase
MGKLVIREITSQPDMKITAAIDAPHTPAAGRDAGEIAGIGKLGVTIVGAERLAETLRETKPDVLVDFTIAGAAVQNVCTAVKQGVSVVVGTTGFTSQQRAKLAGAVKRAKARALIAPNMSVGVNVFFELVKETARLLGKGYDVDIVETHHVHKVDAPSGTALRAAEIVAKELGLSPKNIKCGRPAGKKPRKRGEIYIHSLRIGGVIGEHTVVFAAPNERVEITHRAQSREAFAAGAIKAIRHVVTKGKPGVIQDMRDVLGLK